MALGVQTEFRVSGCGELLRAIDIYVIPFPVYKPIETIGAITDKIGNYSDFFLGALSCEGGILNHRALVDHTLKCTTGRSLSL